MDSIRQKLWIDTDIALGAARGDVDDGFALAAVFAAVRRWPERFELLGISAVAGNTSAAISADCAARLAAEFGLVPGIAPGIPADLPHRGPNIHLLALGPLTNVARLLGEADCTLLALSIVGGVRRRVRHPILNLLDLNARRDPAAWRAVTLATVRSRRRYPLDVIRSLDIGASELDALAQLGGPAAYLCLHSRRWLRQTRLRHPGGRFPVWDLVAALDALALLPSLRRDGEELAAFDAAGARRAFLDLMAWT